MKLRYLAGIPVMALALTAAHAAPAGDKYQSGAVHSCTTNGDAIVFTSNYGFTWVFDGHGAGHPEDQRGVVDSASDGGHANVQTTDGGIDWYYTPGGPLYCSPV